MDKHSYIHSSEIYLGGIQQLRGQEEGGRGQPNVHVDQNSDCPMPVFSDLKSHITSPFVQLWAEDVVVEDEGGGVKIGPRSC